MLASNFLKKQEDQKKQYNDPFSITGIAPDSHESTVFTTNIKPTEPLGAKSNILSPNAIMRQTNTFGGKTRKQKKNFAKSKKHKKSKLHKRRTYKR
jgi:hypothetical protein